MANPLELCVECPDGSIEIFESQKKKSNQSLLFALAAAVAIGFYLVGLSSSQPVTVLMARTFGLPLAIVSTVLALLVFFARRNSAATPVIKFTREGFSTNNMTGKWSDISKAYATEHTCVLLSRKAGEIQLFVMYLELSPVELLKLVHRFAPNLSVE